MDYDEDNIRKLVLAGLRHPEPYRVELEPINYGERLGVFYRGVNGIQRVSVETRGKTDNEIAFDLLSALLNRKEDEPKIYSPEENDILTGSGLVIKAHDSPYEGKSGRHPASCFCSKHKGLDGQQAA